MWCHRRLSFFLQHQWTSTVSVCLVHNLTPFFFVFCVLNIFCHIVDCTVIWDVWQRQFDSIFGAFCLYDRGLVLWKRMKWKLGENDCHSVNSLKKKNFFSKCQWLYRRLSACITSRNFEVVDTEWNPNMTMCKNSVWGTAVWCWG